MHSCCFIPSPNGKTYDIAYCVHKKKDALSGRAPRLRYALPGFPGWIPPRCTLCASFCGLSRRRSQRAAGWARGASGFPILWIPHVDLENRTFVLKPMAEMEPYFRHPISGKTMIGLLRELEEREDSLSEFASMILYSPPILPVIFPIRPAVSPFILGEPFNIKVFVIPFLQYFLCTQ